MNTIYALALMIASFTIGLVLVAIIMLIMGIAGAPGAFIFDAGRRLQSGVMAFSGFILAFIGQGFVVCAYTVFVVSVLRTFSDSHPNVPTWPLWIAAFFQSSAVSVYAMKERPDVPTAQHMTLGLVSIAAIIIYFIMAFAPQWLVALFGWIPFFQSNLKS